MKTLKYKEQFPQSLSLDKDIELLLASQDVTVAKNTAKGLDLSTSKKLTAKIGTHFNHLVDVDINLTDKGNLKLGFLNVKLTQDVIKSLSTGDFVITVEGIDAKDKHFVLPDKEYAGVVTFRVGGGILSTEHGHNNGTNSYSFINRMLRLEADIQSGKISSGDSGVDAGAIKALQDLVDGFKTSKADKSYVDSQDAAIKSSVTGNTTKIGTLTTTVGDSKAGLVKQVADNKTAIAGKANSSDLGAKADKATVTSLSGVVGNEDAGLVKDVADIKSGKADKTELAKKADTSALNTKADKTTVSTLSETVGDSSKGLVKQIADLTARVSVLEVANEPAE